MTQTQIDLAAATENSAIEWEAPEWIGGNDAAVYIVGLTFGVHAGDVEDRDGNMKTTYTTVYAFDGAAVGCFCTFDNAQQAVDLAEALHEERGESFDEE